MKLTKEEALKAIKNEETVVRIDKVCDPLFWYNKNIGDLFLVEYKSQDELCFRCESEKAWITIADCTIMTEELLSSTLNTGMVQTESYGFIEIDELFHVAWDIVENLPTIEKLTYNMQVKLKIGYNRAARIMEQLAANGNLKAKAQLDYVYGRTEQPTNEQPDVAKSLRHILSETEHQLTDKIKSSKLTTEQPFTTAEDEKQHSGIMSKDDLKSRLEYVWDFANKNSDIDLILGELWNDILISQSCRSIDLKTEAIEFAEWKRDNWYWNKFENIWQYSKGSKGVNKGMTSSELYDLYKTQNQKP